ncbi:9264_t:CDS:1, partial [Racocetra fulgida]
RNLKKPSYILICQWIVDVWNDIPADMVINSFKKCGIPNGVEKDFEKQMVISMKNEENLPIPIVYMENLKNMPEHWL